MGKQELNREQEDTLRSAMKISRASVHRNKDLKGFSGQKTSSRYKDYDNLNRDIKTCYKNKKDTKEFRPLHVQEMVLEEGSKYTFLTEIKPVTSRNKRTNNLIKESNSPGKAKSRTRNTTEQNKRLVVLPENPITEHPLASSMILNSQMPLGKQ